MKRLAAGVAFAALLAIQPVAAQLRVEQLRTTTGQDYVRVGIRGQLQSLHLIWRDGSPLASEKATGLASAVPYLMGRGPKGEALGELIETLRDYQASFNFYAGTNASGLTFSAPPEHFAAAIAILKRFIENPALPDDRLDTYRRDYGFRARQALKKGDLLASQLRYMMVLPPGPLRAYHMTDPARLDPLKAADIAQWKQSTLLRNTVNVVTAGPMTHEEVQQPINDLLAALPVGEAKAPPPSTALSAADKTVVLEQDVPQTIVQAFGITTVDGSLSSLKGSFSIQRLGGGAQGRLFAALRDRLGATYGAQAGLDALNWDQHVFTIRVAAEHDKAAAAIAALKDEYRRWWEEGMTEAEFNAVKSAWQGTRSDTRRQSGIVASQIASAIAKGQPADYFKESDRLVDGLTREDINAYIKANFPRELALVVVAPKADVLAGACVIKRIEEAGACGLK